MEIRRDLIVFIPVHNDLDSLKHTINSLHASTNFPFTLLIIESGSTDGAKEYCDRLRYKLWNKKVEVIHTEKEGPLKAYNMAFTIAKERKADLFLTQTDVGFVKLYKRDWLAEMYDISNSQIECGAITSLNGTGTSSERYVKDFQWFGAWCTYLPYRVLEAVGIFDDKFEIGDGVDIDYAYRVAAAGFKNYMINYWVEHHHTTAHVNEQRPDLEDIKIRNGEYFRKKHNLGEFKQ
jgi:GT2 family glycosyltransferase